MGSYVTVRDEVDVWPTNWKLLVENFMDAYHVFKVHKESFGADGDSTGATEMYPGTLDWAHHRVVEADGPDLTADADDRLDGEWRRTIVLAAVFPGFVIQLQPDWLWFLRITPVGTDRVRIAWQVAVAPATLEAADDPDDLVAGINALVDQVNNEDYPVVAGIPSQRRPPAVRSGTTVVSRAERLRLRPLSRYPPERLTVRPTRSHRFRVWADGGGRSTRVR
jgi:phenylpropionate dioxygenase-like ring-hydroxylating dioxygenase large terminal subunit